MTMSGFRTRFEVMLRLLNLGEGQLRYALCDFDIAVSRQEGRIKALKETIAQRDQKILELTREVSELKTRVAEMQNASAWEEFQ